MLLLIGYYHPVLAVITDFIKALLAFDLNGILWGIGVLTPFGIGVVIGIFAIARLVEIIFESFPLYAYWAIIGLILSSPVAILIVGGMGSITVVSVLTGAAALAVGFAAALKLGE